jgi:hypothetical protein
MRPFPDNDRDRLIDRLVDGELTEGERQLLLARLDADPSRDGWRRCALAFLEAQVWCEAFGPAARAAAPIDAAQPPRGRFRWAARLAMAAGVLGAFTLGWLARGESTPETPVAVAPVQPTPALVAAPPEPAAAPVTDADNAADGSAALPESVFAYWERQGFQVERQQRVISLGLDNGRNVPLPVSEVRLRYVGDRVY